MQSAKPQTKPATRAIRAAKKQRLALALKANLARRKQSSGKK